jgi:hypothetical protein
MIKYLYVGIAALFILTAGYSYARATPTVGDAPCITTFSDAAKKLPEGAKVSPLSKTIVENLVEKLGPPPGVVGEFELHLITIEDDGMIVIVQGGCVKNSIGPANIDALKQFLGIEGA